MMYTDQKKKTSGKSELRVYPLAGLQIGLFFHASEQEVLSTCYINQTVVSHEEALNIERLKQAWRAIMVHHPGLRAGFRWHDAQQQPVMFLSDPSAFSISRLDYSHLNSAQQTQHLRQFLKRDRQHSFQLDTPPLMRVTLIQLSETCYRQVWTHHHILLDGYSVLKVIKAVMAHYDAGRSGVEPAKAINEAQLQYIRYFEAPEAIEPQLSDWSDRLSRYPGAAPLQLPKPRLHDPAIAQKRYAFKMRPGFTRKLEQFARQRGVNLNTLFETAWGCLIAYYTQKTDVVFGSIRALPRSAFPEQVGLLINTLPVRLTFDAQTPVQEVLHSVYDQHRNLRRMHSVPLSAIQNRWRRAHPEAGELFHSAISYMPRSPWDMAKAMPGWTHRSITFTVDNHYTLMLELLKDKDGTVQGRVNYAVSQVSASLAKRIGQHFQKVLKAFLQADTQAISQIDYLTQAETHCIGVWNDTKSDYPPQNTVVSLFEAQVQASSQHIAAISAAIESPIDPQAAATFQEQCLTYAQLNERVNQLAHYLISKQGVRHESIVGVCLPRTLERVIAFWAILKAGGVYLPLSPDLPGERICWMLDDAQACCVLTMTDSWAPVKTAASRCSASLCYLDRWSEPLKRCPTHNPGLILQEDQASYLIYTSGTTGQPKGVVNVHRGTYAQFQWMQSQFRLTEQDRLLHKTPCSFDVSLWELIWPFLTGARLILPGFDAIHDTQILEAYLQRYEITVLHFVPSLLKVWLDETSTGGGKHLRLLLLIGEALTQSLVNRCYRHCPSVAVYNLYGPAEASIDVSYYRCHTQPSHRAVPIGRPIANTQLYVIDPQHRLCPPGMIGELAIAGASLARGYLNRPSLNATQFISVPWARTQGRMQRPGQTKRLYRTGDYVYQNPQTGDLIYLSRRDRQIKLRGQRIELGEIEACLSAHPAVRQAAVAVIGELDIGPSRECLVGFYVPARSSSTVDEQVARTQTLRHAMQQQLPSYMVPSLLQALPKLPLTAHGKLDIQALRHTTLVKPEASPAAHLSSESHPACSDSEQLLQSIWSEVLGLKKMPRHANFFELGGDSIMSIQVAQKARAQGWSLTPRLIFEHPTLADLSPRMQRMSKQRESKLDANQVALAHSQDAFKVVLAPELLKAAFGQAEVEEVCVLSPIQSGILLHSLRSEQASTYLSQVVLHLQGTLDRSAFTQAWKRVVACYPVLRTGILYETTEQPVQVVLNQVSVPIQWRDISHQSAKAQQRTLSDYRAQAWQQPFDFSKPPLFRLICFKLKPHRYQIVHTDHHILSDGWSKLLLFQTVFRIYADLIHHRPPVLPPQPQRYSDYLHWLHQQDSRAARQYWQSLLTHYSDPVKLSVDRLHHSPLQPNPDATPNRFIYALTPDLSQKIRQLAAEAQVSLATLMQAVWVVLLSRYSGQADVVFGSVLSGRHVPLAHIAERYGLFIQTMPVRITLESTMSLHSLVHALQTQFYQSQPHAHYPLVEIHACSDLSSNTPVFEYTWGLHNYPFTTDCLKHSESGLTLHELCVQNHIHYPLNCLITPGSKLSFEWVYEAQRFEHSDLSRLMSAYEHLLISSLTQLRQPISMLNLGNEQATLTLPSSLADVSVDAASTTTVHGRFEQQVAQYADRPALVYQDHTLTYRDLNQRANQLARHLVQVLPTAPSEGVDILLAIALPRGLEQVIGCLAVLKAGCAYLPLNVDEMPLAQLKAQLQDSEAALLITHSQLRSHFDHAGLAICLIDQAHDLIAQQSASNLDRPVAPQQLAYLLYTSGSTGQSKGVLIEHRHLMNSVLNGIRQFEVNEHSRVLAVAAISFDVSIGELYIGLLSGAAVYLSTLKALSGPSSSDLLNRWGITMAVMTPSVAQLIQIDTVRTLKTLALGGEVCPETYWHKLFQQNFKLINVYGPTETVFYITAYCPKPDDQPDVIGQPSAHNQAWVLDAHQNPVSLGQSGELYLSGRSVGRGYWKRPALTQQAFLTRPGPDGQPVRLYRTGDRVQWSAEGHLIFQGRLDHQVKHHGRKLSLVDLEQVLLADPAVRQAAVCSTDPKEGHAELFAYVVVDHPSLRKDLRQTMADRALRDWAQLSDALYQDAPGPFSPQLGWQSSYTREPIPSDEMADWVDQTLAHIRAHAPQQLLEVGCGSGLLCHRLIAQCQHYTASDVAARTLQTLWKNTPSNLRSKLRLILGEAVSPEIYHAPAPVDMVVLNSVIQYFPSLDYLLAAIDRALSAVKPGGQVFIGDVRHLGHQAAFGLSVMLYQGRSDAHPLTVRALQSQLAQCRDHEKELLVDPAFFEALVHRYPKIDRVAVHLKKSRYGNEMTRFRYDVILYKQSEAADAWPAPKGLTSMHWAQVQDLEGLRRALQAASPEGLAICKVPNAYLIGPYTLLCDFKDDTPGSVCLKDLYERSEAIAHTAVTPYDCAQLGEQSGYHSDIRCSADRPQCFDAIFYPTSTDRRAFLFRATRQGSAEPNWGQWGNDPLMPQYLDALRSRLRRRLIDCIGTHALPTALLCLDQLPLTVSGKVDRQGLPKPYRPHLAGKAPSNKTLTPSQKTLLSIWQALLGRQDIGLQDNFFELGGNSLLILRLSAHIRNQLKIEIPLPLLFEVNTLGGLSEWIQEQSKAHKAPEAHPCQSDFFIQATTQPNLSHARRLSPAEAMQSALVCLQPLGYKPPLFLIHPIGGTVFCYYQLVHYLKKDRPVYAMQDPGIASAQPLFSSLEDIASAYIRRIQQVQAHGPYLLGGASSGGNIAVEMARKLQADQQKVSAVWMFDSWARLEDRAFRSKQRLKTALLRQHRILKAQLSTDRLIDPVPLLKLNYQRMGLMAAYRMPTLKDIPLVLYKAQQLLSEFDRIDDAHNFWDRYVSPPVSVYPVPGSHETMLIEPHIKTLAQQLQHSVEFMTS